MSHNDLDEKVLGSLTEMLRDKDYDGIRVCDLCDKAGVSRATFYRHYNSIDDVVIRMFDSMMGDLKQHALSSDEESWIAYSDYMHRIFHNMYGRRETMLLLGTDIVCEHLRVALEKDFGSDTIADKDRRFAVAYHIGGIAGFTRMWLGESMMTGPEEIAEIAISLRVPVGRPVLTDES